MKKKLFIVVFMIIATLTIALTTVACTPDKIEKIVGTYELVLDTFTQYEQPTVDKMKEYGVKSYIVLTGNDFGYYVYQSKDVAPYAIQVKLKYDKNDEGKITSISYTTEEYAKPNSLHVDSKKDVYLVIRMTLVTKIIDGYETQYKKVSDKTDLSYVKSVYPDMPVYGYNLKKYNALYSAELTPSENNDYAAYIYDYYDVDSSAKTATRYYALKSDKKACVVKKLEVRFDKNAETNVPVKMTIGETEFSLEDGAPARKTTVVVDGADFEVKEMLFNCNYLELKPSDYEKYFNDLIAKYETSLIPPSEEPSAQK